MRRDEAIDWGRWEVEYFVAQDWTGEIRLKWLEKFRFARGRILKRSGRAGDLLLE